MAVTTNRGYPIPDANTTNARADVLNNTAPAIVAIDADMKTALDGAAAAQSTANAALPKSGGIVTGPLTAPNATLFAKGAASEGGELQLEKPTSGSTLAGNLVIDLYGNILRIFENGGAYRGLSFDISGAASQSQIATTTYVDSKVAALVGAAPATLDTIVELAARIESESSEGDALLAQVGTKAGKAAAETISATWNFSVAQNFNAGLAVSNEWVRINGNYGMYWNTWGGGWFMGDATWIQAYGGKGVYTTGAYHGGQYQVHNKGVVINANGQVGGSAVPNSMAMSQDSGATLGNFTCYAAGAGDANLAGMTFFNSVYALKMGVRADGVFGIGGWSRAPWSWYTDASGNMVAAGNVTAYSDPRLKENSERIIDPLAILGALDGVTFTWKYGFAHTEVKAGKRDYGILADQVKAVMPEIVTPSIDIDGEQYDTVDYSKLVPVLIEANKALLARIQALEAKLGG